MGGVTHPATLPQDGTGHERDYLTRALCRARAFLLEQFLEQYLERGRAISSHPSHAQIWQSAAPLGAITADLGAVTGLDGAFLGAFVGGLAGFGSILASRLAATEPVSMASSSEGLRRGATRLGTFFALGFGFCSSKPSGIAGLASIGGRLFEHNQH